MKILNFYKHMGAYKHKTRIMYVLSYGGESGIYSMLHYTDARNLVNSLVYITEEQVKILAPLSVAMDVLCPALHTAHNIYEHINSYI